MLRTMQTLLMPPKQLVLAGCHRGSAGHHCPLLEAAQLQVLGLLPSAFNIFFLLKLLMILIFQAAVYKRDTRLILNKAVTYRLS